MYYRTYLIYVTADVYANIDNIDSERSKLRLYLTVIFDVMDRQAN